MIDSNKVPPHWAAGPGSQEILVPSESPLSSHQMLRPSLGPGRTQLTSEVLELSYPRAIYPAGNVLTVFRRTGLLKTRDSSCSPFLIANVGRGIRGSLPYSIGEFQCTQISTEQMRLWALKDLKLVHCWDWQFFFKEFNLRKQLGECPRTCAEDGLLKKESRQSLKFQCDWIG